MIRYAYTSIAVLGAIGIILFFVAIAFLILELTFLYFELKDSKSQAENY